MSSSEISSSKDRLALEAYEKRNAEIDSRIIDDITSNHNNAALLYYQALLLLPDANEVIQRNIDDVYEGAEPDRQIKIFLGKCLPALELLETASRMPQCTFEVWIEEQTSRFFLRQKLTSLIYIIAVDAHILATDGHYLAALKQCLSMRQLASHLSDDSQLCLFAMENDFRALKTIWHILGTMPLEDDIFVWLRGQLALNQGDYSTLESFLRIELKKWIKICQTSSNVGLRAMLTKMAIEEITKQSIQELPEEQIQLKSTETIQRLFGSIFSILDSEMNAEQKYTEIQKVISEVTETNANEFLLRMSEKIGEEIIHLMFDIKIEMTEDLMLDEIKKIIDKLSEPDSIQLLTSVSDALGLEISFRFMSDSNISEEQKIDEMQKIIYEFRDAFAIELSTIGFSTYGDTIGTLFTSRVRHTALINSTKAAVELYLILANTGQLPEELPDYLPKDPYTNLDFLYEVTDDGFVLGCQSEIFERGEERFTFNVQKQSN
ncbi:hypothetical protein ACFLZ8_00935 [Planctomycetota bacterium]